MIRTYSDLVSFLKEHAEALRERIVRNTMPSKKNKGFVQKTGDQIEFPEQSDFFLASAI